MMFRNPNEHNEGAVQPKHFAWTFLTCHRGEKQMDLRTYQVHARSEIKFVYPQKRIMCGYLDDTLRFFLQVRGSPRYILPGGLTLPRIRGCWMAYTQWYLPGPWRKPWKSSGHIVLPPAWAELVSEPPPVTKNDESTLSGYHWLSRYGPLARVCTHWCASCISYLRACKAADHPWGAFPAGLRRPG